MQRAKHKITGVVTEKFNKAITRFQTMDGEVVMAVELPPELHTDNTNMQKQHLLELFNSQAIQRAAEYGQCGWALYDDDINKKCLIPLHRLYAKKDNDGHWVESEYTQDIDEHVAANFSTNDISSIFKEIKEKTDAHFHKKLNRALVFFRQKDYYDCALLLSTIIDSYNIHILLSAESSEQTQGSKQGVKGLAKVISKQYAKLLSNNTQSNKLQDIQTDIIQYKTKQEYEEDSKIYELINLIYAFDAIFENVQWENMQLFPATINRHLLVHGLYEWDDIKRYDCIKLLVLLRKLVRVISWH